MAFSFTYKRRGIWKEQQKGEKKITENYKETKKKVNKKQTSKISKSLTAFIYFINRIINVKRENKRKTK